MRCHLSVGETFWYGIAHTVRGNDFNGAQWRPCHINYVRAEQAAVFTLEGPVGLPVSSAAIITHESAAWLKAELVQG